MATGDGDGAAGLTPPQRDNARRMKINALRGNREAAVPEQLQLAPLEAALIASAQRLALRHTATETLIQAMRAAALPEQVPAATSTAESVLLPPYRSQDVDALSASHGVTTFSIPPVPTIGIYKSTTVAGDGDLEGAQRGSELAALSDGEDAAQLSSRPTTSITAPTS
ncbi:hypothetical protein EXIGLDRAFT_760514 [Exidia glandulosa HHB12029]|uniref:Uncharacterized protein n=1 Tax=Exidia glandulosa HHB12029 TaxID=1314781 RepID=A0A165PAZ2_EXIGL|nr:hypothetical protein EXIGLDRAFT_760514 [Exidia glandulosa HHB12029]